MQRIPDRVYKEYAFARRCRGNVVFHFQIRLHKGRNHGLFYAVASVRTAVRNPSDVYLDHTGRSLFWRKYRRVCIEYPARRGHRRDRPYMVAGQLISNIMQISATSY